MSFFDTTYENQKSFNKPVYFKLTPGKHTMRILGAHIKIFTHWLPAQRVAILCLNKDCPICKKNQLIMMEHPDDFSKQPGFLTRQPRHLMNILDKTLVKVCPKCQTEIKAPPSDVFPPTCTNPDCGELLTNVQPIPSDKVKVLNLNNTDATNLNNMSMGHLDKDRKEYPLTDYDINWVVSKAPNNKVLASPFPGEHGEVAVKAEALFDLTKVTLTLTPEEIEEALKGVQIRDIFLARKSAKAAVTEATEKQQLDVEEAIGQLFNS